MKVFVYGSLRKGMSNHDNYLSKAKFLSYGYVKGSLYSLHGVTYPGLIDGNTFVLGEIYDVDKETSKRLDELEYYIPGDENSEYRKIEKAIFDKKGNLIDMIPVYYFNMDKEGHVARLDELLEDGDYVAFMLGKHRYAVSACLTGVNCKYNGGNNHNDKLMRFLEDKEYICVCPELVGGLSTPRACCEIVNGRVMNTDGEDKTEAFYEGSLKEVQRIKENGCDVVILQPRSPSCGYGKIYDGSFSGKLKEGNGIFAQMCSENGLSVFNSQEFLEKYFK